MLTIQHFINFIELGLGPVIIMLGTTRPDMHQCKWASGPT